MTESGRWDTGTSKYDEGDGSTFSRVFGTGDADPVGVGRWERGVGASWRSKGGRGRHDGEG